MNRNAILTGILYQNEYFVDRNTSLTKLQYFVRKETDRIGTSQMHDRGRHIEGMLWKMY